MKNQIPDHKKKGVSIRILHYLMACVTLVISICLLLATFQIKSGYSQMRVNTRTYIQWERNASGLLDGSDYLTEQVRCFVETGNISYLENYFEEAKVTRRRENAIEAIHAVLGDSDAYKSLETALVESNALMRREYYAMRLAISAFGYDCSQFPEQIQEEELSEEDAMLSPEQQGKLARDKVFDDVYRLRKGHINTSVEQCMSLLAVEMDQRQQAEADALDGMLRRQRILIIAAITATLLALLATILLVIRPLLRAVGFIREEQPIPVKGSAEFRFLAKTYNQIYEEQRGQREQLAYDAIHDKLTGIYNRSGYDYFMENTDWSASCLLLFDVDKFKLINDTLGHNAGDRMLVRVASVIRDSFRVQDYVCRIGGDEFAVIMVRAGRENADLICRKVEQINAELEKEVDDLPPIRVSCGAAFGGQDADVNDVFRRADEVLYEVKNSGGASCRISE